MGGTEDLIAVFSDYKNEGLISAQQFSRVATTLLGRDAPVPDWIRRLQEACALAREKKISQEDLDLLSKEIFASIDASGKNGNAGAGEMSQAVRSSEGSNIVRICTAVACVIGLIPLPIADAPFLIITQYVMLRKLCGKYGREPGATLVLIVISALLGPLIFNAFVKRFPYAGSIAGACVAAAFTWFVGTRVQKMLDREQDFTWKNIVKSIFSR